MPSDHETASSEQRVEALAKVLREHIARDRYREDGESIGTECTCGGWSGNYFADGEAGPFDDHLAEMLADSPAMRDLLAEAKADAWDEGYSEGVIAANELVALTNPYRETSKEQ